jgi:hypothetical protein
MDDPLDSIPRCSRIGATHRLCVTRSARNRRGFVRHSVQPRDGYLRTRASWGSVDGFQSLGRGERDVVPPQRRGIGHPPPSNTPRVEDRAQLPQSFDWPRNRIETDPAVSTLDDPAGSTRSSIGRDLPNRPRRRGPCRKLTLGCIGGVVRPKLARPTSDRWSGRHGK